MKNENPENGEPKVATTTGVFRGIGATVAKRLVADGFSVAVNYAGRVQDAGRVVAEIVSAGGRAEAIKAGASIPAEVTALFDEAEKKISQVVRINGGII